MKLTTLPKPLKIVGCAAAVIFVLSMAGCQTSETAQKPFKPADGSSLVAGDALGKRCYPTATMQGSSRVTDATGSLSSVDVNW